MCVPSRHPAVEGKPPTLKNWSARFWQLAGQQMISSLSLTRAVETRRMTLQTVGEDGPRTSLITWYFEFVPRKWRNNKIWKSRENKKTCKLEFS